MSYAIIALGGKQYRVQEGQRLLVDRLPHGERKTFHPAVLFLGGDGQAELAPAGVEVTARVLEHTLGEKVRIGKYRPKSGYKRHNGYRSRLSRIEIEAIGKKGAKKAASGPEPAPAGAKPRAAAEKPEPRPAAQRPKAAPSRKEKGALPDGYAEMTVAQVSAAAKGWELAALEAALAHERAGAARKGAIGALESAIKARKGER